MNEKLFQFIWQHQYFNTAELQTEQGDAITIVHPGNINTHEGPDFVNATIKIGTVTWRGHVELHIGASDWLKHGHQHQEAYQNVILHVVWNNDAPILHSNGSQLPTLCLQGRISGLLLNRYYQLMQNSSIACSGMVGSALSDLAWLSWKERLAAERLHRKSEAVLSLLHASNGHWEAVCWWMIAGNFGIKQNQSLFEQVAKSIDITILAKHKQNMVQLEALLLGQAHLLSGDFTDDYVVALQKEFAYLKHKYQLPMVYEKPVMLRMRPAAFPAVRLALLAALIHRSTHLFACIKSATSTTELLQVLQVSASAYWDAHYVPGKLAAKTTPKHMGVDLMHNIIINTFAPLIFAYGVYHNDEQYKEKAIGWLQAIEAEKNRIVSEWQELGIKATSAFDSQALIELTKFYCTAKKCLDCAVGNGLLRKGRTEG